MQVKALWILLVQILAVHGTTFYLSGQPKPWLSGSSRIVGSRLVSDSFVSSTTSRSTESYRTLERSKVSVDSPDSSEEPSRMNNPKKSLAYDGNVLYAYDTKSGIYAYQSAAPKLLRTGALAYGVEGSYSYTSPDGTKVTVTYTADENGYHPRVSISRH